MGIPLFDPLAGVIVSGMIVKAGCSIGWTSIKVRVWRVLGNSPANPSHRSIQELADAEDDPITLEKIVEQVEKVEGVMHHQNIRNRKMGPYYCTDLQVWTFASVVAHCDCGNCFRASEGAFRFKSPVT